MAKVAIQGGVKNYLGNQKTVGNVPLKWQSGPDAPDTELAYITKAEKNLLLKKDLHGSLKNGPNTGPEGIMSLDSQGDKGEYGNTGQGYGDRQTSDKSAEDVSASRNRTAADKKQRRDLLTGKLGYQNDPNNQNRTKAELGKAYTKGAYDSFGFGTRLGMYDKQYKAGFIDRKIEKKKKAIRDYIASKYTQNPHMDIDEIMEGITGSYDPATQTFGTYDFTSGLNKGTTFDINNYGKGTQLGPFGLSTTGATGKPLGTNYLDTTTDLTSNFANSKIPSFGKAVMGYVDPININTLKSTLNRINQLDDIALSGVTQTKINDYYDKSMGRGKYDIFGGGDGDGQQSFIPIDYNTGAASVEAVEPYTNDFTYRGDGIQNVGRNVTDATYAADGGIMGTRARRAFGGIMDRVTGRKAYGLGSIFKSVGKAVKGVAKAAGKVLKSDVGKMALMAAGAYYAPAMFGGTTGFGAGSTYGNFARGIMSPNLIGPMTKAGSLGRTLGNFAINNKALTAGIVGLGGLSLFGREAKPNEDIGMGERGGPLLNSQGDGSQGSIAREIQEAYASGDSERIAQLQKFYGYKLPALNAVQDLSLPSSLPYPNYAEGGRIGFNTGKIVPPVEMPDPMERMLKNMTPEEKAKFQMMLKINAARMPEYKPDPNAIPPVEMPTYPRTNRAEGGLMDLGGMEKDYRNDGGFVPIGEYEKKDDVPARLSVNEFVFTADAVRGAGGGDIDKGAEIMENVMKNLEDGGQMSKESQGNTGAQEMFSVSQRLGEVL